MATFEGEINQSVKSKLLDNISHGVKWVPLSLTYIEYPEGDIIGCLLAVSSFIPYAIVIAFGTLCLFRRDLHTIFFFMGMYLSEIINMALKYIIQEPRPMRRDEVLVQYGMPSSHSQFMWFYTTYMTLFIYIRLQYRIPNPLPGIDKFYEVSFTGLNVIMASLTTYSRVYLLYHTTEQVIWGLIVGVIWGITWFWLTHLVFTPLFPVILTWRISESLLLRDTTLIPNIIWFEYTTVRAEARSRYRKAHSMK